MISKIESTVGVMLVEEMYDLAFATLGIKPSKLTLQIYRDMMRYEEAFKQKIAAAESKIDEMLDVEKPAAIMKLMRYAQCVRVYIVAELMRHHEDLIKAAPETCGVADAMGSVLNLNTQCVIKSKYIHGKTRLRWHLRDAKYQLSQLS
jgi:hypothetical protein